MPLRRDVTTCRRDGVPGGDEPVSTFRNRLDETRLTDRVGYRVGAERNRLRLPDYSRLDVRAHRSFSIGRQRLTLFVEVINALTRENVRGTGPSINATTGFVGSLTESLFPLLPSAEILIEF